MRPRLDTGEGLQWGRDLSVAEGRTVSSTSSRQRHGLQWGRDLSVAEGRYRFARSLHGSAASMGPRPFGRGRLAPSLTEWKSQKSFNGAATFRSRKEPGLATTGMLPGCFNGAATFRSRKGNGLPARKARHLPLQWGRDLSVAEGRGWSAWSAPLVVSFNGAATFRSRKGLGGGLEVRRGLASMGPRPFGRGRRRKKSKRCGIWTASMGPRPFGRGRRQPPPLD